MGYPPLRKTLLGIITVDDVFDVAEEEATEDMHKLGGMEALDVPYMRATFGEMLQKRAPWLIVLFFGQMLTLQAMKSFGHRIETAVALVFFIPLIISSGGNSGTQAATLVVRAMALGQVEPRDWWRVLRRELGFGLVLGVSLALLGALRIFIGTLAGEEFYGPNWGRYALAIGISLMSVVVWGVLVGSTLPFVLLRLGFDPAATSTPFLSTIVDVTGLSLYLTIAFLII